MSKRHKMKTRKKAKYVASLQAGEGTQGKSYYYAP